MSSLYSRDPRVPPVRLEHLGKHHRVTAPSPVGLPPAVVHDDGPTYEDFLEPDTSEGDEKASGQTG